MKIKFASPGIMDMKPGHAGTMELSDGTTVNYGVIRIEGNKLVHYTGQGLREMWKPEATDEAKEEAERLQRILEEEDGEKKLIGMGHIAVTPLERIVRVL